MSEVAKVREALDFQAAGQTLTPLERAFVAHGLKVCEEAGAHAARGITKFGCLDLIAAILRDAGLEARKS